MTENATMEARSSRLDLASVRPGDRLEAWYQGVVQHQGIVEELVPHLGVVWIREPGSGRRKMLDTADFDLLPARGPSGSGSTAMGSCHERAD